jgi:hypothetical protein
MPRIQVKSKSTDSEMTSDEWCTPHDVADPLAQFFGGPVGVDPCSNDRSVVQAHTVYTWGGLSRPWCRPGFAKKGDTSFANWPYSTNDPWAGKAAYEMRVGHVRELVILCMTAVSTKWWSGLMAYKKRNPRVICTKRLKFLGPDGQKEDSSRFDPALIYYGTRLKAFDREFGHLAQWSTWGR